MQLLFDLDGTLTDSFPGIGRSINYTLAELGREPVREEHLRVYIGAPLSSIFGALLDSKDVVLLDRAVSIYRDQFDGVGINENRLLPGIAEALSAFHTAGHTLQVVTVRSAVSARHVVQHFGLDQYFAGVHGPEPTERACDKATLVLAALTTAGARPAEAIMVGDRVEDIRAARAHGVRAVAAGWGYGVRADITAAQPDYVADTIADLVAWVQSAG